MIFLSLLLDLLDYYYLLCFFKREVSHRLRMSSMINCPKHLRIQSPNLKVCKWLICTKYCLISKAVQVYKKSIKTHQNFPENNFVDKKISEIANFLYNVENFGERSCDNSDPHEKYFYKKTPPYNLRYFAALLINRVIKYNQRQPDSFGVFKIEEFLRIFMTNSTFSGIYFFHI